MNHTLALSVARISDYSASYVKKLGLIFCMHAPEPLAY